LNILVIDDSTVWILSQNTSVMLQSYYVRCAIFMLLIVVGWAKNSRFVWKRPAYVMPWTRGANICAVEEVSGSRKRYYSECMTYMPRRICDKQTFIRYHCCTGYERVTDDARGCEGVSPVVNIEKVVSSNPHLQEFKKHVRKSGMRRNYMDNGTYTVFAPENPALRALSSDKKAELMTRPGAEKLTRYHTIKERHYLKDMRNDVSLPTLSVTDPSVRINRYSNGIVTVNCARIVAPDIVASNGIVHTTEKLVEPFMERGTIMDILLNDEQYQFGELATALIVTQLGNILRGDEEFHTVFAPTDEAFRNAPQKIVDKILNDKDLLQKLLKYHILKLEICSAAILGHASLHSLEGQKVNLTCDINDLMRVNNIAVRSGDILATNGLIHVLDEILVPDSVLSLEDVLLRMGMYEFLEYAQQAGIADQLQGKASGNFTVFVPSLQVFTDMPSVERHMLQTQPAAVHRVFQYHLVPGRITTSSIQGESVVRAASGHGDALMLKVLHPGGFSVNGARFVSANHETQNGVIHIIDRILSPPELSVWVKVQQSPSLSTFMGLIQIAEMENVLLDPSGNFTLFAPTNKALEGLSEGYLDSLRADRQQLSKFLRYHIVHSPTYVNVHRFRLQYRYESLMGEWVKMRTDYDDFGVKRTLINGNVPILGSANLLTNGVMYEIDEVMKIPIRSEVYP